jgi:small glutamine-rich tetratricopeptide repeat-containing protein alpha
MMLDFFNIYVSYFLLQYKERKSKAALKFLEKYGSKDKAAEAPAVPSSTTSSATPTIPKPSPATDDIGDVAGADAFKNKGNQLLSAMNYEEAIGAYSEAIKLSSCGPNSHIYYSNRAAAHSQLCNYEEACDDAEKAVALNPKYSKAHSRLGHAHYQLGRYGEAVSAYRAALNLEPNNKDWQKALDNALLKESGGKAVGGPKANAGSGMGGGLPPNLASMMNNPALGE